MGLSMKFKLGELFCGPGGIGYDKWFLEKNVS
jgi:hypothetical protein